MNRRIARKVAKQYALKFMVNKDLIEAFVNNFGVRMRYRYVLIQLMERWYDDEAEYGFNMQYFG
jgi:hypothetical protein